MARLPQPGSDGGVWGDLLNEYLLQIHKSDGTLRDNVVTATSLAPGAVQASNLLNLSGATNGQVLTLDSSAPGGYRWSSVTGGGTQVNADWNAASGAAQILNKPTLGTAASANVTAFATAAQGAKADTAVQPGSLAAVAISGSYADLAGRPTIPTTLTILSDVAVTAPTTGQALVYDATSAAWKNQTVSGGIVTSVAGKTGDVALVESDIANLTTDLAAKVDVEAGKGLSTNDLTNALLDKINTSFNAIDNTVFNAKANGLVGDGVVDDAPAFQALINLVSARGGGVIYLPKGRYRLVRGGKVEIACVTRRRGHRCVGTIAR